MKHKTWFRLVIKAIGVLLSALAMPSFVRETIMILDAAFGGALSGGALPYSMVPGHLLLSWSLQILPTLTQLGVGIYLVVGGAWIVNKCIPSNRPYCPECGYDLSHHAASASNCPECGVALRQRPDRSAP